MKKNNVDDFFKELEKDNKKIRKWRKWYKKEKEIIDFLSNLRNEKGISQQELADYTGIKQPAIARLENRINSPQLSTLIKYVDALGLEIEIRKKGERKKMKKEKDIKTLEKITKFLIEAFISLDDIEDVEEIFNSDKALKVIKKYPSINASIDDLLYELSNYFEELASLNKIKKGDKKV